MENLEPIAVIRTGFPTKFGVPRQSGLVSSLKGRIVFNPEYRNPDSLRGLDGFSHIWLIWHFSEAVRSDWSPTVRPPRLGGNTRMGVFATRSPFRPNHMGLSCVEIESVEYDTPDGPVINVLGADLMDGTPIFDIKPYIAYTDSHPHARCGFTDGLENATARVDFPEGLMNSIPTDTAAQISEILSQDPRPRYQNDPDRIYGFEFDGYRIRFTATEKEIPSDPATGDRRDSCQTLIRVISVERQ